MCLCDLADSPSAFSETHRRARKRHQCDECHRHIEPGDRYQYVSGIWDGRQDSYKTCARCELLRAAHMAAEKAMGNGWCHPPYTALRESVNDCRRYDGKPYVAAIRQAFKRLRSAGLEVTKP